MRVCISILTILWSLAIMAQQKGTVTGKTIDLDTKEAIPYATIVIKKGTETIAGGITDDQGVFKINNLQLDTYAFEIQFMGYDSYRNEMTLSESAPTLNLGTITLKESATILESVEVVAERSTIEQKIDRKIINVGRDLTTAGATASEIMNNIPSVNVDQDGRLSLRGNENVRVLIDGRPTNMDVAQLLKQIPSTSIKTIELITNPSAKYNPEGMSGIINIILHKNANDGFNASINNGLTIAQRPKVNNSIDMNYRTGKVNFFGTYGNNFGDNLNWGNVNRSDDQSTQDLSIVNSNKSHLMKIGMDYYINDKNTVSAYTNQNFFRGTGSVDTDLIFPNPDFNLQTRDRYHNINKNETYNVAYKHLFNDQGHTLDVEANYIRFKSDQDANFRFFNTTDFSNYDDFIIDTNKNLIVNVDYVNPINETTKIEFGAESRIIRSDNQYDSTNQNLDPDLNNLMYSYDLDIHSLYATFGQKINKWSYQLGARLESYQVRADLNDEKAYRDDYITVYPSAFLTYALSEKNQFQVSYSRRVDRPSLNQTKPIREFATPRISSFGNPELDPQFTNSLEFNFTRNIEKGSYSGGVFYRMIQDEINRVILPNPDIPGNLILSYDNFDKNTAYGFELSANYRINSWWDIQPSFDYSNISQKGLVSVLDTDTDTYNFEIKEVEVAAFNARFNSNFKAGKQWRFLLFGFYRSKVDGVQFNSKDMYKIDSGARYTFLENKATLSVRFNDMFNTMRYAFVGDNPFPQTGEFTWESQSVFIGFNYRFGAGKNRALQRKYRDDNTKQSGGGLF